LRGISPEEFEREGILASARFAGAEVFKRYDRILLYLSMEGEFDTGPAIAAAFAAGKEVYFPRTEGDTDGRAMRFYRAAGVDGPWVRGNYGILEPADAGNETLFKRYEGPALIVTPCLAFDREGRRLGRGAGYYDRFFASLPEGDFFLLGLSLDCQIVDTVPTERFDRRVNAICTAGEYIDCA
jgi:5-formyltetrahydrofolate cyclo-ligase